MKKILILFLSIFLLGANVFVLPVHADELTNDNDYSDDLGDYWLSENGDVIPREIDTVVVYDSRNDSSTSKGPALGYDYSIVYNHSITLSTSTEPYHTLGVKMYLYVTLSVYFNGDGSIKSLGSPEVYNSYVQNLDTVPSYTYGASASKLTTTKYRVNGNGQITGIPYNPSFSGYVDNQT